jgi:hypothetical protein
LFQMLPLKNTMAKTLDLGIVYAIY